MTTGDDMLIFVLQGKETTSASAIYAAKESESYNKKALGHLTNARNMPNFGAEMLCTDDLFAWSGEGFSFIIIIFSLLRLPRLVI